MVSVSVLVIDTGTSQWLILFSFCFFFFLVLVKRHTELLLYKTSFDKNPTGRGYKTEDIKLIQPIAIASAMVSLVVFGLYIESPKVQALYTSPNFLWAVALLGLLWIINVIALVHREKMHNDPIVFAFTNKTSLGIFLISIILIILSL